MTFREVYVERLYLGGALVSSAPTKQAMHQPNNNGFLLLGRFNNGFIGLNGFLLLGRFNSGLSGLNGFLLLGRFNSGLNGLNGFLLLGRFNNGLNGCY